MRPSRFYDVAFIDLGECTSSGMFDAKGGLDGVISVVSGWRLEVLREVRGVRELRAEIGVRIGAASADKHGNEGERSHC